MKKLALTLFVLAPVALSGCQTIREHNPFRHRSPPYQAAQQEQPLEMPPGMNQPPTAEALVIPSAGTPGAAAGVAGTVQQTPAAEAAPAAAGATPPSATATPEAGGSATSMTLADTPQSVYHRVGLALARGDAGQVTAHNDTALSYDVAVDTTVTSKPEGGFLHRMFHHAQSETVKGDVTVTVTATGDGTLVAASGAPAAAAEVMNVLRERLK